MFRAYMESPKIIVWKSDAEIIAGEEVKVVYLWVSQELVVA
jgi:hypothetical protein